MLQICFRRVNQLHYQTCSLATLYVTRNFFSSFGGSLILCWFSGDFQCDLTSLAVFLMLRDSTKLTHRMQQQNSLSPCQKLWKPHYVVWLRKSHSKAPVACTWGVFWVLMCLPVAAGFRRSMRLSRRKSRAAQPPCPARCPGSCYSTLAAPYEEVVRYQRHPADRNRLIILVGKSLITSCCKFRDL